MQRVGAEREIVQAPGAPPAIGPYSHAVIVRSTADLLFCSGQIPLDPVSGELVGDTPAEQARRCLENLRAVCEEAGTTLDRAVRVTVYMLDLSAFAQVNDVYASFFTDEPPARVTVGVAQLPRGAYVEIDAVVALPASTVGGSTP
ncbi:MAG: endoribonuclease [Solirubrobacterales bacterium]|nr:endoribonuclease [Solirubrobacterales bacterium]